MDLTNGTFVDETKQTAYFADINAKGDFLSSDTAASALFRYQKERDPDALWFGYEKADNDLAQKALTKEVRSYLNYHFPVGDDDWNNPTQDNVNTLDADTMDTAVRFAPDIYKGAPFKPGMALKDENSVAVGHEPIITQKEQDTSYWGAAARGALKTTFTTVLDFGRLTSYGITDATKNAHGVFNDIKADLNNKQLEAYEKKAGVDKMTLEEKKDFYKNDPTYNFLFNKLMGTYDTGIMLEDEKFDQEIDRLYQNIKNESHAVVSDWGLDRRENDSEFMYNLGAAFGSLAASIAINSITGGAFAGKAAVSGVFGAVQGEQLYDELIEKGVEPERAKKIATAGGLFEGGVEAFGLNRLLKNITEKVWAKAVAKSAVTQGGEELIQQTGEELVMWDFRQNVELQDKVKGILMAALYGAILGSFTAIASRPLVNRHAADMKKELVQEHNVEPEAANKWVDNAVYGGKRAKAAATEQIQKAIVRSKALKSGYDLEQADKLSEVLYQDQNAIQRLLIQALDETLDPETRNKMSPEDLKKFSAFEALKKDFDIYDTVYKTAIANGVVKHEAKAAALLTESYARVMFNLTGMTPAQQWENGGALMIQDLRSINYEDGSFVSQESLSAEQIAALNLDALSAIGQEVNVSGQTSSVQQTQHVTGTGEMSTGKAQKDRNLLNTALPGDNSNEGSKNLPHSKTDFSNGQSAEHATPATNPGDTGASTDSSVFNSLSITKRPVNTQNADNTQNTTGTESQNVVNQPTAAQTHADLHGETGARVQNNADPQMGSNGNPQHNPDGQKDNQTPQNTGDTATAQKPVLSLQTKEEIKNHTEESFKKEQQKKLAGLENKKVFNESLQEDIGIFSFSIKNYKLPFADKFKQALVPYLPQLLKMADFSVHEAHNAAQKGEANNTAQKGETQGTNQKGEANNTAPKNEANNANQKGKAQGTNQKGESQGAVIKREKNIYLRSVVPVKIDHVIYDAILGLRVKDGELALWDVRLKKAPFQTDPAANLADNMRFGLPIPLDEASQNGRSVNLDNISKNGIRIGFDEARMRDATYVSETLSDSQGKTQTAVKKQTQSQTADDINVQGIIDGQNALDELILKSKKTGAFKGQAIFGKVSEWLKTKSRQMGLDLNDFSHVMNISDVKQIKNMSRSSQKGAQISDADIQKLPVITANPDFAVFGTDKFNLPSVILAKKMPDGSTIFVLQNATKNKTLTTKAMWKVNGGVDLSSLPAHIKRHVPFNIYKNGIQNELSAANDQVLSEAQGIKGIQEQTQKTSDGLIEETAPKIYRNPKGEELAFNEHEVVDTTDSYKKIEGEDKKQAESKANEHLKSLIGKPIDTAEGPLKVQLMGYSRSGILRSHTNLKDKKRKQYNSVLLNLEKILPFAKRINRDGRVDLSHNTRKQTLEHKKKVNQYIYFVAPVQINGEKYFVEFSTEQMKGENPNLLELYNVRIKRSPIHAPSATVPDSINTLAQKDGHVNTKNENIQQNVTKEGSEQQNVVENDGDIKRSPRHAQLSTTVRDSNGNIAQDEGVVNTNNENAQQNVVESDGDIKRSPIHAQSATVPDSDGNIAQTQSDVKSKNQTNTEGVNPQNQSETEMNTAHMNADSSDAPVVSISSAQETYGLSENDHKTYLRETLQDYRDKKVFNNSLGGAIEIQTSPLNPYTTFLADENNRAIVPYVPYLLQSANFTEVQNIPEVPFGQEGYRYWTATVPVQIDGGVFDVRMNVKQSPDGRFIWDAHAENKTPSDGSVTDGDVNRQNSDRSPAAYEETHLDGQNDLTADDLNEQSASKKVIIAEADAQPKVSNSDTSVNEKSLFQRENPRRENHLLFQVTAKVLKKFHQDLKQMEKNKSPRGSSVRLESTPFVYQVFGIKDKPVILSQQVVDKAKNAMTKDHNVPQEVIDNLPVLLSDPLMVLKSATQKGDLVVVLDAVDKSGRPVFVILRKLSNSFNVIPSIYGRDDFARFLNENAHKGRVLYVKGKARDIHGAQLPEKHRRKKKILNKDKINERYLKNLQKHHPQTDSEGTNASDSQNTAKTNEANQNNVSDAAQVNEEGVNYPQDVAQVNEVNQNDVSDAQQVNEVRQSTTPATNPGDKGSQNPARPTLHLRGTNTADSQNTETSSRETLHLRGTNEPTRPILHLRSTTNAEPKDMTGGELKETAPATNPGGPELKAEQAAMADTLTQLQDLINTQSENEHLNDGYGVDETAALQTDPTTNPGVEGPNAKQNNNLTQDGLIVDENNTSTIADELGLTTDPKIQGEVFAQSAKGQNVVDLTNEFKRNPKLKEVIAYIQEIIDSGKKFGTLSPDWFIDIPHGSRSKKKLINNSNYKKLSHKELVRLNKYLSTLEQLLSNAQYVGSKRNFKTEKKSFVEKYHYFKSNVKIGNKVYEILFDTEQFVGESEAKPQTVHLYNVTEVSLEEAQKGRNLPRSASTSDNPNIAQNRANVNNNGRKVGRYVIDFTSEGWGDSEVFKQDTNNTDVMDLTQHFDHIPTTQEMQAYLDKIIQTGQKFSTLSPDWMVDVLGGKRIRKKILNSGDYKKLDHKGINRHNRYVMALEELLARAEYVGEQVNLKRDSKEFVEKYHYFRTPVKVGTHKYDVIFDTEQHIDDNITTPQTVHLYNINEVAPGGTGRKWQNLKQKAMANNASVQPTAESIRNSIGPNVRNDTDVKIIEKNTENVNMHADDSSHVDRSQEVILLQQKLAELIVKAKEPGTFKDTVKMGKVDSWLVRQASEMGLEIDGYEHAIDVSAIKHIQKKHGNAQTESSRGQISITDKDIKLIPLIVSHPDYLIVGSKNHQNNPTIIYVKQMNDGSIIFVEEVRTKRQTLSANTMWKMKGEMKPEALLSSIKQQMRLKKEVSGQVTADSDGTPVLLRPKRLPDELIIAKNTENVNSETSRSFDEGVSTRKAQFAESVTSTGAEGPYNQNIASSEVHVENKSRTNEQNLNENQQNVIENEQGVINNEQDVIENQQARDTEGGSDEVYYQPVLPSDIKNKKVKVVDLTKEFKGVPSKDDLIEKIELLMDGRKRLKTQSFEKYIDFKDDADRDITGHLIESSKKNLTPEEDTRRGIALNSIEDLIKESVYVEKEVNKKPWKRDVQEYYRFYVPVLLGKGKNKRIYVVRLVAEKLKGEKGIRPDVVHLYDVILEDSTLPLPNNYLGDVNEGAAVPPRSKGLSASGATTSKDASSIMDGVNGDANTIAQNKEGVNEGAAVPPRSKGLSASGATTSEDVSSLVLGVNGDLDTIAQNGNGVNQESHPASNGKTAFPDSPDGSANTIAQNDMSVNAKMDESTLAGDNSVAGESNADSDLTIKVSQMLKKVQGFDKTLYRQDGARGYIIMNDVKNVIRLLQTADPSTIIHEMGHYFTIRYIRTLHKMGRMNELQPILGWLDVPGAEYMTLAHKEKLARAFETYVMEGVAPNARLKSLFKRFKVFIGNVYRNLVGKVIPPEQINADVRVFFDKMLATDYDGKLDVDMLSDKSDALQTVANDALQGIDSTVDGVGTNELQGLLDVMYARLPREGKSLADALREGRLQEDFMQLQESFGKINEAAGSIQDILTSDKGDKAKGVIDFLVKNGFIDPALKNDTVALTKKISAIFKNAHKLAVPLNSQDKAARENILKGVGLLADVLKDVPFEEVAKALKNLARKKKGE